MKKISKQNRRHRNKIIPFWWTEIFVLILIAVSFGILFSMERTQYHLTEKHSWSNLERGLRSGEYHGQEEMTEAMLRDYLYDIMEYVPTYWNGDDTKQGSSRVGFAAAFYDDENNVIVQSGQRNIHLYYEHFNEETQKYEVLWSNLEDYFSEPAVDMFVEHCQHSDGNVTISYIDGYYAESGEFVLTGMGYTLEKEGEKPLFFENKMTIDPALDAEIIRRNNSEEDTFIRIQFYNEKASQNEKAWELLNEQAKREKERDNSVTSIHTYGFGYGGGASSDFNSMVATMEGGGVYGIVVYYVPLAKLVFTSPTFWLRFVGLSALIQIGMLIIYVLYREIMEKQRELDHMRNTFINAMAHEMKTPAAVIKNGTECIKDGINPEKNQHYLDMISYEADHLNDLLSKMLLYTRTSEGVYALHKENLSLMKVVNEVIPSYQLAMEFKGVALEIKTEKPKEVCADEMLLKMVIDNFISNGIRYGNEDGKMIITVEGKGVSVYNEGKSLSLEEQKRIWEPLYVIDKARSETDGSAGMGLAICKNILELHKAEYGVENMDNGVRFFFQLP